MTTLTRLSFFCIVFGLLLSTGWSKIPGQKKEEPQRHDQIVERVTVTNVEVPVRVLFRGEPVTDLTVDDFTLYENKKKMKIHGFFLKRKKIKFSSPGDAGAALNAAPRSSNRAFVLAFSITDFNPQLQKAVDHLFNTVLRKGDMLMVFVNDRQLKFPRLEDKALIKNQLLAQLREGSMAARRKLIKYINQVENLLEIHNFKYRFFRRDNRPERLLRFLKKYLLTWNEYKKLYLTPRTDRFFYFSRFLENLDAEKWVLNFYQFEMFPRIRFSSDTMDKLRSIVERLVASKDSGENAQGKMINNLLNQIVLDLNVNTGFPTEQISKLFYKVDATFHSFFIRSMNTAAINDLEYDDVSSDIEQILKEITDITGGKNIASNDLVTAIDTVSELEDTYYMLTYVPQDKKKAGKLKIKVKNKKYKVLYDDNFRTDYIADYIDSLEKKLKEQFPDIKIDKFSFKKKILAFVVRDYFMRKTTDNSSLAGKVKVRIRLNDKDEKPLFDQTKVLAANKAELSISLPIFKTIKKGEYNFRLDVTDLLTGKEATLEQRVNVKR